MIRRWNQVLRRNSKPAQNTSGDIRRHEDQVKKQVEQCGVSE
jgi:hypothetical protein